MSGFKGEVGIVTGGGSGLGEAIGKALAARGRESDRVRYHVGRRRASRVRNRQVRRNSDRLPSEYRQAS